MSRTRVFVDTNVILEAVRINCWKQLCNRYAVETVDKCIEEARTGDPNDTSRIQVPDELLTPALLARHPVSKVQIATLILAFPDCIGLDAGEQHLLAHLHTRESARDVQVLLSTADRAAITSAGTIGWLDSLVALEAMAKKSGAGRQQLANLRRNFLDGWLDRVRLDIRLAKSL
jgi:hypothetical protein